MFGGESSDRLRLLQRRKDPDVAVDNLSPGTPFGRWCTLIVKTQDDVSIVGNCTVKQTPQATPLVVHRRVPWFSIDIHQGRIFPGWIKVRRLDHPTIEGDTAGSLCMEELGRRSECLVNLLQ